MMKVMKNFTTEKLMKMIAALALVLGVTSMSQACFFAFNQPKVPQALEKFRKEK